MALGSWAFGTMASKIRRPLRVYAFLELGIAASALLYFALFAAYRIAGCSLYETLGHSRVLAIAVKLVLSLSTIGVPAFFMGGTFPLIAQYIILRRDTLGRRGSVLYGCNTLGAVAGALSGGFFLPVALGYRNSYLSAVCCNAAIALACLAIDSGRHAPLPASKAGLPQENPAGYHAEQSGGKMLVTALAFVSGLCTIGLEVLWTRMFALVHQNSVYVFSALLVVVLGGLALGSFLAARLCRLKARPDTVLSLLLLAAGICVAATPYVFLGLTSGQPIGGTGRGWFSYVIVVFRSIGQVIFVAVVLGTILPYLLRVSEPHATGTGKTIGRLMSVNTAGGIAGSLFAGFIALSAFGMYTSIKAAACIYLAASAVVAFRAYRPPRHALAAACAVALIVGVAILPGSSSLNVFQFEPGHSKKVLEVWEGSAATVGVIRGEEGLTLKVNNNYRLGSTSSCDYERFYAQLPLLLHPAPRRVFFLGMGTGITAGAALNWPVEKVVVTELIPEVVGAAKKHFTPYLNGLFADRRAEIIIEDGRHYLLCSSETYDVIAGDLFNPEEAGSLYSREHFQAVLSRLNAGGIFAQWVPLFQLTRNEFFIIVRTMLEVFPQVTLWRADFSPIKPAVALIATPQGKRLDSATIEANIRYFTKGIPLDESPTKALPYFYYAGNLTLCKRLFEKSPVNTDNRPLIEYLAPVTPHTTPWFVSRRLATFYEQLLRALPPEKDPYLERLSEEQRGYVVAGMRHYRAAADAHGGN